MPHEVYNLTDVSGIPSQSEADGIEVRIRHYAPHDTPDGSIHIITAPATAPMPINRVSIFCSVFILRVCYSISQILSSRMIFGADFPAKTNIFLPFL